MNCFTHALPHLDDAYLAVGVCLPDWLSACDRKCRTREKHAIEFVGNSNSIVSTVAKGVIRHHRDDHWFHQTPMFNKLILEYAMELRQMFGNERTMRPSLVGHIVVELFLDAYLNQMNPGKLEYFYQQVAKVDAEQIQNALNLFATKPTDKLVNEIERFIRIRYLFDYDTDEGIIYWINKIFKRIKLDPLGPEILEWMPQARQRVYDNAGALLPKYPIGLG